MIRMRDAIVVVPARKGSKRIPGKNMLRFHGRPLISYSILTGHAIKRSSGVYVASDNKEIGLLATEMEATWIPLPEELTTDEATLLPVLQHVLRTFEDYQLGGPFLSGLPEWIILLQPTCPLRDPALVNEWADKADRRLDVLLSVDREKYKLGYQDGEFFQPNYTLFKTKQSVYPRLRENGVFYMFKSDQIRRGEFGPRILPLDTPTEQSLANIDTLFDLDLATYLFERYNYEQFFPDLQGKTTVTGARNSEDWNSC